MTTVLPEVALTQPSELGSIWTTTFGGFADTWLEEVLASAGSRGFTTSGTSGRPVTWVRDAPQLVAEADITVNVLGREHDAVHSTVPPESLYGFAAILVAAALKVPFTFDRWGFRRWPIGGTRPLIFSIPPSWSLLPAALTTFFEHKDRPDHSMAVTLVHAGARLPRLAADTLHALQHSGRRLSGIELFGASETGLVASREFSVRREDPWDVVDDVELVCTRYDATDRRSEIDRLTVRSPRVGRRAETPTSASTATTGDLIAVDGTTMRIIGRDSRRLKPGGRWVDLDLLDEQLRVLLPGFDFATTPVDDPLWGEHVELIVVGPGGGDVAALHHRLRQHSDQLDVVPIRIRTVAALDLSPMGKVRVTAAHAHR